MRFFRFSVLLIAGLLIAAPVTTFAAEGTPGDAPVLLLQKHLGKGLNCAACHQETPPAKPVAMGQCLSCHGTYDQLADKTDGKGSANPHASHNGDLSCDSCHHVHKASVNYCSQCHEFEFKVP